MNDLFGSPPQAVLHLIHSFPALVDKTFPLPGRFRAGLPEDIAELSRLMTSDRGARDLSYLSRPNHLSAYLRYFLPWNIFRLCRLLPNLDVSLSPGDAILDLGCGPLTLALSLWISRPDLRKVPLEFRCIDRTATVLEAGRKLFAALAGEDCPWKIVTIRGSVSPMGSIIFGTGKRPRGKAPAAKSSAKEKPVALVCAVNMFNEIYRKVSYTDRDGIRKAVASAARLLDATAAASILVVEPGIPFAGAFISSLRSALLEKKRFPAAPCPHCEDCPFPGGGRGAARYGDGGAARYENRGAARYESGGAGRYENRAAARYENRGAGRYGDSGGGKKRWCHFAFDTEAAPPALLRLSAAADIPKERATMSFLYTAPYENRGAARYEDGCVARYESGGAARYEDRNVAHHAVRGEPVRVISDAFPLPDGKSGRYACSRPGLILLRGRRTAIEACVSGTLVAIAIDKNGEQDQKSGALLVELYPSR